MGPKEINYKKFPRKHQVQGTAFKNLHIIYFVSAQNFPKN